MTRRRGFPGAALSTLVVSLTVAFLAAPSALAEPNDAYVERAVYSLYTAGVFKARHGDWAGALVDFERAYRVRPVSPEILSRYAEALWKNGRRLEAVKFAERAVTEDSAAADAWLVMAEGALFRNDARAADHYLARRVQYKPDDLESRLKLGFLRENLGDAEGVVEAFRGYPSRRPGSAAAQFHLGVAYNRLGRIAEARQAFRGALRENPGYLDAAQNVAILSEELGEDSEAIAAWNVVLELDAGREEALRRRVMLLLQSERYAEAGEDVQRLLRMTPDRDGALRRLLAQISVRTGELAVAARAMLDLAELRGSETGYLEVAMVAAQARTETNVLTRALERAWELGLRPEVGRLLLSAYLSTRDDTNAVGILERLRAVRPADTNLPWTMAVILHRMGRVEEAERSMEAVLEREPGNHGALNFLGYSWTDRGVHLEKARDYILRALEADPSNPEYIDSLGWVWFRLGRYEEAVTQLEKAAELSPDEPVILEHLGDAYLAAGRRDEALRAFREALEVGRPADPEKLLEKIHLLAGE